MANKVEMLLHVKNCYKCMKVSLHCVTAIEGICSVLFDITEGKLIVIGDADPVCVANCLKKKFKCAELIYAGPVPPPPPPPLPPPPPPPPPIQKCHIVCEIRGFSPCSVCSCKPEKCCPPRSPSPCRQEKCYPRCSPSPCKPENCPPPCSPYPCPPCPPYPPYPCLPCPPYPPVNPCDVWYAYSDDKRDPCTIM